MLRYFIKRIIILIPTLIGISIIIFVIMRLAPGDPVTIKTTSEGGESLSTKSASNYEAILEFRRQYHLDEPIYIQYLLWLKNMLRLDFGKSIIYSDRSVASLIVEKIKNTLWLTIPSIFLIYLLSIPIGIYSAIYKGTYSEQGITLTLFILYSLPSFWVALILQSTLGNQNFISSPLPITDLSSPSVANLPILSLEFIKDRFLHMIMPVFCLTYVGLAYISRQMRGAMLEVIRQDYILTARAKGLSEWKVIFKHALRNSLIPIITLFANIFPALVVGGSIVIETIFRIDGIGKLSWDSIQGRDYPVVMGLSFISAFLTLLGIIISDILYVIVNPQITFEKLER